MHSERATSGPQGLRRSIDADFFAVALILTGWLLLGVLDVVPLVSQLPGESTVRSHVAAAVLFFTVAAWGFKAALPSCPCLGCGLAMSWRRRWVKTWADVQYCSDACRCNESARG